MYQDEARIIALDDKLSSIKCVIIFGAGEEGRVARSFLRKKNINVLYFCDNDQRKQGTFIDGIKVLDPMQLIKFKDIPIAIASDWSQDIALQLRGLEIHDYFYLGFSSDYDRCKDYFSPEPIRNHLGELDCVSKILSDNLSREVFQSVIKFRLTSDPAVLQVSPYEQYFHPLVKPEVGDVIIDAGAWIGDTAIRFAKYLDSNCKVFSFEPARNNYQLLLQNIAKEGLQHTIVPLMAGLWREDGSLSLTTSTRSSGRYYISKGGGERINVISLDTFVKEEGINIKIVKMDIEGSEIEALQGAKDTLLKFHPKLQISLYHKAEDFWKIPLLINSINPNYRFYLGHHTQGLFDTVLYAN